MLIKLNTVLKITMITNKIVIVDDKTNDASTETLTTAKGSLLAKRTITYT